MTLETAHTAAAHRAIEHTWRTVFKLGNVFHTVLYEAICLLCRTTFAEFRGARAMYTMVYRKPLLWQGLDTFFFH